MPNAQLHYIIFRNHVQFGKMFTAVTQCTSILAVSAVPAWIPTSNRCCTGNASRFILLFNLLSLKLASLPEP